MLHHRFLGILSEFSFLNWLDDLKDVFLNVLSQAAVPAWLFGAWEIGPRLSTWPDARALLVIWEKEREIYIQNKVLCYQNTTAMLLYF